MTRMHAPTGLRSRRDFQAAWSLRDVSDRYDAVCGDEPLSCVYRTDEPVIKWLEEDEAYWLFAELPGMHQDDMTVWIEADRLKLKGEWSESEAIHLDTSAVRPFRAFSRQFILNQPVDPDSIHVTYVDGMLTVSIHKSTTTQTEIPLAHTA